MYVVVLKLYNKIIPTNKLPSGFILHLEALETLNNQILVEPYPDIIEVYLDLITDNLVTGKYPALKVTVQELTIYLEVEARDCNNTAYLKACFNSLLEHVTKLLPNLEGGY